MCLFLSLLQGKFLQQLEDDKSHPGCITSFPAVGADIFFFFDNFVWRNILSRCDKSAMNELLRGSCVVLLLHFEKPAWGSNIHMTLYISPDRGNDWETSLWTFYFLFFVFFLTDGLNLDTTLFYIWDPGSAEGALCIILILLWLLLMVMFITEDVSLNQVWSMCFITDTNWVA